MVCRRLRGLSLEGRDEVVELHRGTLVVPEDISTSETFRYGCTQAFSFGVRAWASISRRSRTRRSSSARWQASWRAPTALPTASDHLTDLASEVHLLRCR